MDSSVPHLIEAYFLFWLGRTALELDEETWGAHLDIKLEFLSACFKQNDVQNYLSEIKYTEVK